MSRRHAPSDVSTLSTVNSRNDWTKKDRGCLLAQMYAVSHLHEFLPMCPVAWICFELDRDDFFLKHVYLKSRRWTTLRMALCMLMILVYGTCIYANTFMSIGCQPHHYIVGRFVVNATGGGAQIEKLQRLSDACNYREWLMASHPVVGVINMLVAFTFAAVGKFVMHINQSGAFSVLICAEYFLPRVFYSGLGPVGSMHSGKTLLKDDFSYFHDLLGTADLLLLCLSTALATFASSIYFACSISGRAGASYGAAIGAFLARMVLLFLNYAMGSSNEFITFVNGELASFQPHRKVLNGEFNAVNEPYIEKQAKKTEKILRKAASELSGDGKAIVEAMADRVQNEGKDIVVYVAGWLRDHHEELAFTQGCCFRLYSTKTSSYTCGEYELAALSMLKIPSFLVAYVAKELSDLKYLNWETKFLLGTVYIANPDKLMCRCRGGGYWSGDFRWELVNHARELADDGEIADAYRAMPP